MGLPQTFIGLAALTLAGCASMESPPASTAKAEVTGSVFYRERIMLAPPGVVTVTLADTSLADAPAKVIATQVIPNVTAPPINFRLAYDPDALVAMAD